MAIYHFNVSVISRARGQRIVAAAASHAGARLWDEFYGLAHNYAGARGVLLTQILAPAGAPSWVFERQDLWNRVEAREARKDAQLARALDISLPVELDLVQNAALVREFVTAEFVGKGMTADLSLRQNAVGNPRAHVLLSLRKLTQEGFGPKVREWNRKNNLLTWRASWARSANRHLAAAGHAIRIDHRSLEAQQIELVPSRRVGAAAMAGAPSTLSPHLLQRLVEQRQAAQANGCMIIEDPALAIRALTQRQSTFNTADLERFLMPRTADAAQLHEALRAVMGCDELVALEGDGAAARFSGRDLEEARRSLARRAAAMAARRRPPAIPSSRPQEAHPPHWPDSLRSAWTYLSAPGDFKVIALARSDWPEFLHVACTVWEGEGRRVLKGFAAEHDPPEMNKQDVLIVEDAEMIELKLLERLVAITDRVRAKIVLVADARQIEAIGALSPLYPLIGMDSDAESP